LDRLQGKVHRLREQYDQALSSQARDISQLHKIQASNRLTQTLSASRKTNTKESLNFSNMMVESARQNMQQAERELEDSRSKWERSVPALDPESLAPAHAKQKRIRLFKIESEDRHQSMRMTAQQQRFQAQIPRLYLGTIPFENLDTRDSVYDLLFKDLWPSIRGMLKLCFANTMVRLTTGVRGFGADAYLELKQEQRQLRIPVCIVGRDFGAGSAPVHHVDGVQSVQMSFGPQEVSTPQLLGAAQSLVLRTVQLISTEVRANNVGMLLTPSGLMFVRRTHKQTALISRVHSYARSDSASFWCHPVAAIGCCVAQILAAGPTDALEPPMY
ncbi:hypothetical protein IW147_006359, partial [Coemansia sp. RSA 720]